MLTTLTDKISFSLLPLISVLLVAVGMPVLHPILHSHSANYNIISEHYDKSISASSDEDNELNCPICDFLATSQLHDTGIKPIVAEINPADKIISKKDIFLAKIHPLQTEPRAPPVGNLL